MIRPPPRITRTDTLFPYTTLFRTKIARVRESVYLTRSGLVSNEAIPVDVLISPEQVVTNYIKRLIEHPGSLQVIDFAGGKAQLVAVRDRKRTRLNSSH